MRLGSPVRQLLIAYAGVWVLLDFMAALPGSNPSFSSLWDLIPSVFIQGLLVWRLSLGSSIAWGFGLFMSLSAVGSFVLMAAPLGLTEGLFLGVCLVQASILLSPPVRSHVRSNREAPPAAA